MPGELARSHLESPFWWVLALRVLETLRALMWDFLGATAVSNMSPWRAGKRSSESLRRTHVGSLWGRTAARQNLAKGFVGGVCWLLLEVMMYAGYSFSPVGLGSSYLRSVRLVALARKGGAQNNRHPLLQLMRKDDPPFSGREQDASGGQFRDTEWEFHSSPSP